MEPAGICVISSVLGSTLPPWQILSLHNSEWRGRCLRALCDTAQVEVKAPQLLQECS